MKIKLLTLSSILFTHWVLAQNLPLLKVSDDCKYIVTESGDPFFWLGGTAWELIHRLTKEEIDMYLTDRAEKGFTVIQTVILAELNGLNSPNKYGEKPLIDNNPEHLNEKYFELVDYVIKKSSQLGLYVGLLPTWGDKFNKLWGDGPEIFNPQNAEKYGEILAKRYLEHNHIIWILGGDRVPENDNHYAIIRAMAQGIRKIDNRHLLTYHPIATKMASDFFYEDTWLDLDMFQSGHSRIAKEYEYVVNGNKSEMKRPIINGEARYENIPDRFWENKDYGWLDDADVRVSAYWSMLAGAAGYTYGCNDIWQMYETYRPPFIKARTDWKAALSLPGSSQMKYMKAIFEVFPWQGLEHNPSLILNENPEDESFMMSAIGKNKDYLMAYTPIGKPMRIDLAQLNAEKAKVYWFNPRSGKTFYIGEFETKTPHEFEPWAKGWGSDFLLLVLAQHATYDLTKFISTPSR
ncbi:glycoside hydrolase family 140 protein [Cecembia lonarensis]|uniref:Putative endoglucanase n=1 Tax=Cecembia lonarensis (strain CCUG 58316 / KCTC 22772 / LW9) TaxID=1225176 RepID=K1KUQ5_CECL9|nr:glycoside hydrolase family 140 protein [Cecembia lonarensis]EKB47910.1 Putative endoglucanase [Cecembia lonarensis LW9]